MSASAAGLAARKLSGPVSRVQPSAMRVSMTPLRRGCFSRMVQAAPAGVRSQAGDIPYRSPPKTTTLRVPTGSLRPEIAHDFDAGLDVFHRRLRQNSMAQIKDVARSRA